MTKKLRLSEVYEGEIDNFLRNALERWEEFGTPVRPSKDECDLYSYYVKNLTKDRNQKILILGATPELRDIALRHSTRPVVCDIDDRQLEAMAFFMEESGEEKFIQCDWLDIPEDEKYDIILGDASLNMLTAESVEPFVSKNAKLVANNGFNIQRMGTSSGEYTVKDYAKAMEDYRKNGYPVNVYRYSAMLACSINSFYYPQYTQLEMFEKELFEHLTDEEIEDIKPFLCDRVFYYPPKEALLKLLSRYFVIEKIEESRGIGCWGTMSTYVMKRK